MPARPSVDGDYRNRGKATACSAAAPVSKRSRRTGAEPPLLGHSVPRVAITRMAEARRSLLVWVRRRHRESDSAADPAALELHDYRSAGAMQSSAAPAGTAAGVAKRSRQLARAHECSPSRAIAPDTATVAAGPRDRGRAVDGAGRLQSGVERDPSSGHVRSLSVERRSQIGDGKETSAPSAPDYCSALIPSRATVGALVVNPRIPQRARLAPIAC